MYTIQNAIDDYIVEKSIQVSNATKSIYESQKRILLSYYDNNLPLNEFSKKMFIDYVATLKNSNNTKNKRIMFIKQVLRCALENENIIINKDIEYILKFKKFKETPEHYKTISNDNMNCLLTYYNNMPINTYLRYRNKIILGFCLMSGIRRTELTYMKIANIDFYNNYIVLDYTKSRNVRKAYFIEEFKKELQEYIRLYPNHIYLFENADGRQMNPKGITEMFKRWSKKLGFKLVSHDIRHTFATSLAYDGVDVYTLKALMGHTRLTTTQIYIDEVNEQKNLASIQIHNLFNIYRGESK